MPDDKREIDAEIINAAYADRMKEAFRIFAENLGMGQSEHSSRDRFERALSLIRKARDLALETVRGEPGGAAERRAPREVAAAGDGAAADGLSEEVKAMIEHAVEQTQGVKRLA